MGDSLNQVTLIGELRGDPEYIEGSAGEQQVRVWMATVHQWRDRAGQRHASTDWHQIIAAGGLAERCAHMLRSGQRLLVTGRLQTERCPREDRKHPTAVIATRVQIVAAPSRRSQSVDDEVVDADDG
ncbi:MAG: single-stranded DNA-binding protein [Oscillochloridaceae bacterium umkhey_bin13]